MSLYSAGDVQLDEPWLLITWDRACRCVYAEFKAFANSTEFRYCTAKILDVIRQRRAVALVSDNQPHNHVQ